MKIAFLGVGHWHASMYVHAARAMGLEIAGVHDDDPEIARRKSGQWGVPAETDPTGLLDRARPDFAVSLGSHRRMPELLALLIERRIPFLTEKPAGTSSQVVRQLARRCAERGLFNAVAFCFRWHPALLALRELLVAGRLGRVARIGLQYFGGPIERYPRMDSAWMLDQRESGGSSLLNLGVHCLDVLRFLGFDPEPVSGTRSSEINPLGVADVSTVLLRCGRAYALVESGYCATSPKGGLTLSLFAQQGNVTFQHGKLTIFPVEQAPDERSYPDGDFRDVMLKDLLERHGRTEKSPVDLSDAAAALQGLAMVDGDGARP